MFHVEQSPAARRKLFHVEHSRIANEREKKFIYARGVGLEWFRFPGMELEVDIPNAFIGKKEKPSSKELADALGPAFAVWNEIVEKMGSDLSVIDQEWKSYSPKYGWHLKLKVKKRNILYLSPCDKYIRISFILGDRAMKAARESKLSAKVLKILDDAPRYPEGNGVVLSLKSSTQIPSVIKLAAIKLAN